MPICGLPPTKLHGLIGYCPQTDAIDPNLSVTCTIKLFAELVGYPQSKLDEVSSYFIHRFALSSFESTLAGNLSGGNKRKLCCVLAIIGNPTVILIDEATTGIDPASRAIVW
jgi:ABC-type multidrug transport system ATPase subunit